MQPYAKPMLREGALEGKVIVVTGGGTGLGRAMVKYFLELGAKVVITSRKQKVLDETAAELRGATGGEILPLACDVRDYDGMEALIPKIEEQLGPIDVWLNNAAGNFISPTERLSNRAFESIIGIVLQGTVNCTLAMGKHWIKHNRPGTFLNIVTTYAFTGSGYVVPSATAKAGVLALTRSLAVEWAKYGIRSNAIAPGPFPTKGAWERLFPENLKAKLDITKRVPLGRVGEHQELANLAAYMVSDFGAYFNGEVLTLDGGEWLKGAGQFSMLEILPPEMWDAVEQMTRQAKSK